MAIVAQLAGRPVEAEGWYRRGLELFETADSGGTEKVKNLINLANLLVNEVQAGRAATSRLTEAKRYAEQALAIEETLDASAEIWWPLNILARIADQEGHAEEAWNYRHRERETFAAFEGNRYHIDQQRGPLIAAIASAAQGDAQAREAVEAIIPQMELENKPLATAIMRIWSGERDWASLVEEMDSEEALLILRVLETIAQPAPEEVFAALPATIREALEKGDKAAFERALDALSPEEQQTVLAAIQYLQAQAGEESEQAE